MVAVISGSGAGLLNSSLGLLGQNGVAGRWPQGAAGEAGYLNIANGNLVLQRRDDFLAAAGIDLKMVRTYNSQGEFGEGAGRQWKIGLQKQVGSLIGTLNASGSSITRLEGDGSSTQFTFDEVGGRYLNENGSQSLEFGTDQKWTWRDESGSGLYEVYDQANNGRLLLAGDRDGVRLNYEYGESGLVATIRTAAGDITHFEYDANSNLAQFRTVAGDSGREQVRVRYSYDAADRLISVTTDLSPEDISIADGNIYVIQYGYDGDSTRIASIEQTDGTYISLKYQQIGSDWKVASVTDAQGTVRIEYQQGQTIITDGAGLALGYGFDNEGRLLWVGAPGGVPEASFEYDAQGRVILSKSADGQSLSYQYDGGGRRIATRDTDDNLILGRIYTPDGLLAAETVRGASGQESTSEYVYGDNHRLRFAIDDDQRVTEYRYDGVGQKVATLRYRDTYTGARTAVELGSWVNGATQQADGVSTTLFTYDARGLVATRTDEQGKTTYVYDQAGQLLQEISPAGIAAHFVYDGLGRPLLAKAEGGSGEFLDFDTAASATVTAFADGGLVATSVSNSGETLFGGDPQAMSGSTATGAGTAPVPSFATVPHIRNSEDFSFSMDAFIGRFGANDIQFPELNFEMTPNAMMDIWANPDGTFIKLTFALDAWGTAPRYDDKLFVARVQASNERINGVFVRGDMSLVQSELSFNDYTLETFLHDLVVPDRTGGWENGKEAFPGEVLQTSQGFLYRVVKSGTLGIAEPESPDFAAGKGIGSFWSGSALLEYVGAAQYSGAWQMSRMGGLRWYYTNIAAGHLANQAPAEVKRYLEAEIKNVVRDWSSGRQYQVGMKVAGPNTAGMIWECVEAGLTGFDTAFPPQAAIGTVVTESWGVKWRAVGQMHGSAQWFIADTNGEMTAARDADAHDSGAATFVWAVKQYIDATGDYGWLQQASVHPGFTNGDVLKSVLYHNVLAQFVPGLNLTRTFQNDEAPGGGTYSARFMMDNVEVWAGLNAGANLFKSVGDFDFGNYLEAFAGTALAGLEGLWQESVGAYKWEAGVDMNEVSPDAAFYPYVSSQYWASYWGVPLQAARVERAAQYADTHFVDWYRRTDGDDFASLGVHYGRYLQGKTSDLFEVLDGARRRHLRASLPGEILPMEFTAADGALFLLMQGLPTGAGTKYGGLGLENLEPGASTPNVSGAAGLAEEHTRAVLNTGNGNFVLQQYDAGLSSTGLDVGLTRTYNSQAGASNGVSGTWQFGAGRSVWLDAAAGVAYRRNGDGSESRYTLSEGVYRSDDGIGAYDRLGFDATRQIWTWTDGATGIEETYDAAQGGRVLSSRDSSGNIVAYDYNTAGQLEKIVDASGEKMVMMYDTEGRLRSVRTDYSLQGQAKSSTRVYYEYDSYGRLSVVKTDLSPDDNNISDGNVYWTKYSYINNSGLVSEVEQKDGSKLRLTYQKDPLTGDWWVDSMTDGEGRLTRVVRGKDGTTIEDPAGRRTSYAYNEAGRLQKVSDPATGTYARYTYDGRGNVVTVADAQGRINQFAYDAAGNQVQDRVAGERTITRTFLKPGLLQTESVTAETGAAPVITTRYVYDALDRLRFLLSPEGRVTEWRYNDKGEKTSQIVHDAGAFDLIGIEANAVPSESQMSAWVSSSDQSRTQLTEYSYDSRSLLASVVTYDVVGQDGRGVANGRQTVLLYVYDQNGQLRQTIDSNQRQLSYSYDGLGRLTCVLDSEQTDAVATVYDDIARTTITTGINGNQSIEVVDRSGQLLSRTVSSAVASGTTTYYYNAKGQAVMVQDASGLRSFAIFDAAGLKVADVDGDGSLTEYRYGPNGALVHSIAYATKVNVAQLVGADGKPLDVALTVLRPASQPVDRQAWVIYDKLGRLSQEIDAAGFVTTTDYDAAGHVIAVVRHATPVDIVRLTGKGMLEGFNLFANYGDSAVRYFYDKDGHRIAELDAAGGLKEFNYSPAGQLESSVGYQQPTHWAKRLDGSLAALRSDVAGRETVSHYLYDSKGQQVGIIDATGMLTETVFDKDGNVARKVRYATSVNWQAGATIASLRPRESVQDRIWLFTYTKLKQLATETAPDKTVTKYSYDELGKVTSIEHFAGTAVTASSLSRYDVEGRQIAELPADAAWRIAAAGQDVEAIESVWSKYGVSYQYDGTGRRIGKMAPGGAREQYFYDADGRLAHTVNALGQVSSLEYNAFNQVSRSVTYDAVISATTLATLSGGNASGLTTALHGIAAAAIASRTIYDANGRVAATIDPAGGLTAYRYDAFGNVSESQVYATPINPDMVDSAVLSAIDIGTFADPVHDRHQRFDYDGGGRLVATFTALQLDQFGPQWTVSTRAYDGAGNLVATTTFAEPIAHASPSADDIFWKQPSAGDERVRMAYDAAGRVTVTATAHSFEGGGFTWTLQNREYDANGQLSVQRTLATQLFSGEPAAGDLTFAAAQHTVADAVVRYAYDEMGRITHTASAQGLVDGALRWSVSALSYDEAGNLTERTDFASGLSSATLAHSAIPTEVAAWLKSAQKDSSRDRTTHFTYDAGNRLQTTTDAMGSVVTHGYDARGNVVQVSSGGHTTRTVYDVLSRAQYIVDAEGGVTEYRYDKLGRVATIVKYANPVAVEGLSASSTPHDLEKLLETKVDGMLDRTVNNVYDKGGRLRFTIDAQGYVKEMRYDALGRVTDTYAYADTTGLTEADRDLAKLVSFGASQEVLGKARHESFDYDSQGHVVRSTDGEQHSEFFRYDGAGNKIHFINKLGKEWRYSYNALGQLTEEVGPPVTVTDNDHVARQLAPITRLAYDPLGNLTSRTEAANVPYYVRTTRYEYDLVGRQIRTIFPSFSVYDAAETPGTEPDAGPAEVSSGEVYSAITYDLLGNAISNRDVGGKISRKVYDRMGRVKYDIDVKGQVTGFEYDAFGQQTVLTRYVLVPSWTDSDFSEADVKRRLDALDHSQDRTIKTSYDRLGHVATVTEPGSYVFDNVNGAPGYSYSMLVRVTANEYNGFGELRHKSVYGADAANVNEKRTTPSEERYYYNKRGERIAQFVAEDATRGYLTSTEYNAYGEVEKVTEFSNRVNASSMSDSVFGSVNESDQDRVTSYGYDNVGQKTSQTRHNVDVGVWANNGMSTDHVLVTTRYEYDAVGNLLSTKDAGGAETRSYYDATGHVTAITVKGRSDGRLALTTFDRDVYGNVVKQTAYAMASSLDTAGNYVAPHADDADRTISTRYNASGFATSQTDAEGNTSHISYDIYGRVAKQWQNVTSVVSASSSFVRSTYTITQYDELGQVSKVITPGAGVSVDNHVLMSEIISSAENRGYPHAPRASSSAYTGTNQVSLKYPDLGNIPIRVELSYTTKMGYFREDDEYGGMTGNGYSEPGIERIRTINEREVSPGLWMSLTGGAGVTVSWNDSSEPFGGIDSVNGVKVYVLDAAGQWVLKYDSNGANTSDAAKVTDKMRGNVGTTVHQNIYNAFGELTGKSLDGRQYETSEYDNAGNLWRTNSGDGVDKVMFYNVGGQITAQLRNADDNVNFGSKGPYKSAQQLAESFRREDDLAKHIVRNETSYDLMGRAVSQTGSDHAALTGNATSSAATIVSTFVSYNVTETTQAVATDADQVTGRTHYDWFGTNRVKVEFNVLQGLGNGELKVEVSYHNNGIGSSSDIDYSGDYTIGSIVTADQLTAGSTAGVYNAMIEGVQTPSVDWVNAVRVYKKDLNGQWVLLAENPGTTRNGPYLSLPTPDDGLAAVRLEYTRGDGQTVSLSSADPAQHDMVHRFGESALFDLTGLPAGTMSYRLYRKLSSDTSETMMESGQLTVSVDVNGNRAVMLQATAADPAAPHAGRATSRQRLDRWGNVVEVTDPRNPDWSIRYTYNDNNQLTGQEQVAPDVLKTLGETFYDAVGREIGTKDGRGYVQRKVYGEDGRLKQEVHADGGLVEYDYDLFGDRTQLRKYTGKDADDNLQYMATNYAYDHMGHLVKVSNKAVSWLTYEAGSPENLRLDIDYGADLEVAELYAYDELGRRTVTTDGLGGKRVVRYDHAGNVLAEVDQMGNTTSYAYDAFGNKTALVVQDDYVSRVQTWEYDDYGHVLAHVDAGKARIAYTYTKLGQLKTQTSDTRRNGSATILGQDIVYTYDGDQLIRITDKANHQETSYAYDLAGNHLRERTIANGDVVQNNYIQYDQLNRMTRVADGDFNVVIGYDDAGNRESVETTHTVNGWPETLKVMNKFDAMNRQILVDGEVVKDANGKDVGVFGRRSHEIKYDWAGNRISDTYYAGPTNYEAVTTQRYIYDDAGRLCTVIQDGNTVDSRVYDRAGRQIRSGVEASLVDPAKLEGWQIPKEYRIMQYDAAGRMTRQKIRDLSDATLEDVYFKVSNMVDSDWAHQGYSTAGNLRGYYVVTPNDGPKTAFKSDYIWFDTAKEVNASASNSGGVSTTTTEYDGNGHLVRVIDTPASGIGSNRTYINDVNGQVLMKVNGEQKIRSLIANGQLLGTNNGYSVDTSFVNTYQPATSSAMAASASAYTVRGNGETPSSIAKNIWGDGKLWYLIADANALSGNDVLAVGKSLRIPPRVGTIHNDYQTFKPYNAADAVGNTTPAMPTPAAPSQGGGCGVVGQIVAIVVIVVATVYGQEWAVELAAEAAWGEAAVTAAGMAGAAGGAMAANAVTQGVSVALGYQSKFNWKQVAISGISAAVSAGFGGGSGGTLEIAETAAMANAVTQGISITLGLQHGFDWRGVVASAIGAAVGSEVGKGLGFGTEAAKKWTSGERLLNSSLKGMAAGAASAIARGGRIVATQIAADAFGNAMGQSIAEQMRGESNAPTVAQKKAMKHGYGPLTDEAANEKLAFGTLSVGAIGIFGEVPLGLADAASPQMAAGPSSVGAPDGPMVDPNIPAVYVPAKRLSAAERSEQIAEIRGHMDVLRSYADSGNRERYWNYLAAQGVGYAELALGVVRNDTMNGYVANTFARLRATELGASMDERDWNNFGVSLMQSDFAYRTGYAQNDRTVHLAMELPVKDIAKYHADEFNAFGLDARAWTAHTPLSPYLEQDDYDGAERVWSTMMEPNQLLQVGGTVYNEIKNMATSEVTPQALWLAKVGVLTVDYARDPIRAFSNTDKIGDWSFDGTSWTTKSYDLTSGTPPMVTRATEAAAKELNAARAFRLERLVPTERNPFDLSPRIRSR